jgi:hypothetical protein
MAHIPITGGGSISTRWGHVGGYLLDLFAMLGATATTHVTSAAQPQTRDAQLQGDAAAGTADYSAVANLNANIVAFQSGGQSLIPQLAALFQQYLIDMAQTSQPSPQNNLPYAMALLVQQMTIDTHTFNASVPAIGAQTAVGTPVGNPTFVFSLLDCLGRTQQYVFVETLTAVMTSDVQSGATAGQEPWRLTGQVAQTNMLSWDWGSAIYGSGTSITGNLTSGVIFGGSGNFPNLTVNGDFRLFSGANANYPDNWITVVGAAGTKILNGGATFAYLTGGGSIKFVGDSSTLTALSQQFNTPNSTINGGGGTTAQLVAGAVNHTQYCANVYFKLDSASPAAGVLELSVTDGSNTILVNDAGNNLAITVSLALTADTNWHTLSLPFALPQVLPAEVRVRLSLSTALTTGTNLYMSNCAVVQMQELYAGGPSVAGFSGNTNVNASGIAPDNWTFAVTNTQGVFQNMIWRVLNPPAIAAASGPASVYYTVGEGYVLPVATSGATVSDSLMV